MVKENGPLHADGITVETSWWEGFRYLGTREALIAAGVVRTNQFPGEPGNGKVQVTVIGSDGRKIFTGEVPRERDKISISLAAALLKRFTRAATKLSDKKRSG